MLPLPPPLGSSRRNAASQRLRKLTTPSALASSVVSLLASGASPLRAVQKHITTLALLATTRIERDSAPSQNHCGQAFRCIPFATFPLGALQALQRHMVHKPWLTGSATGAGRLKELSRGRVKAAERASFSCHKKSRDRSRGLTMMPKRGAQDDLLLNLRTDKG